MKCGRVALVAVVAVVVSGGLTANAVASTYTVKSDQSFGRDTLRAAINLANSNPGPDTIEFAVAGTGPHVVALGSDLPTVTDTVVIDGYTQAGAVPAPDASTPAEPQIVIDATLATRGVRLEADDSVLRGLVVQGAAASSLANGIEVVGDRNRVTGDFVGTDATGAAAVANRGDGIEIDGTGNVVGGTAPEDRNVVAEGDANVHVIAGDGNTILGNVIGADATGSTALGGGIGVQVDADANFVGGTGAAGNLISGNQTGVELAGDENVVQGNLVGTTLAGSAALPNNYEGVHVLGSDNVIGGAGDGERNVISGNLWSGIKLDGLTGGVVTGNVVAGNLIGTDITGGQAMGNGSQGFGAPGVMLLSAPSNRIGGTSKNAGNVIAASGNDGIDADEGSPRTRVLGNHIGTDLSDTLYLGNAESGVSTVADHTDVGDGTPGGANTIAHNGEHGVVVADVFSGVANDNAIRRNSIFANADYGIELYPTGPTLNDPPSALDADTGANDLQNYPEITSATQPVLQDPHDPPKPAEISFALDSLPSTTFDVDLYADTACGQGKTYVATQQVTTDTAGHAHGGFATASGGNYFTATATPATAPQSTSELSPCKKLTRTTGLPSPHWPGLAKG